MLELILYFGPVILVVLLVLLIITQGYVKAPPDHAYIISGLRKEPRVLVGRAGLKLPFFEQLDKLYLGQITVDIKTDEYIPTNDFINVMVDAVAKVRVADDPAMLKLAMRNFLNKNSAKIAADLQDSLQGNMREIIGTLTLRAINTDRDSFSDQVMAKASKDMEKLGIEILSCNIQNVTDEHGLIQDLGMDNTSKIRKDASIAKAEAERDIAIAQAAADKASNEARVLAETEIAQKNNELAIKKAELQKASDTKKAEADAAYEIQKQEQQKTIQAATVNAQIAKAEREAELRRQEVAVQQQALEAEINKKADADRYAIEQAAAGDIVAFAGLPDISIGNTICDPSKVQPLPFVKINDPTVEMTFSVNDSPLAGREGKYVTSRQIRDRLQKELLKDVALKVEDSPTTDSFRVMGRGEMHLSILIETMRREGYELQVSPPHVLTKVIDGKTYEPMEHVVIDVPTQYQGAVMTGLGQRKALLQQIESLGTDRVRLEFRMPSRGLFGYRNQFLTDTHGEGIINQIFDGYDVWAGMIANRSTGSLVSFETGDAVTYGLYNAQQRGTLLIGAGEKVYEGMVIGYTASGEDVDVNVCKTKHLTNTRSSGSDDALRLIPVSKLSLEGCLEFLAQDELLEVTPKSLRLRKKILDPTLRKRAMINKKA